MSNLMMEHLKRVTDLCEEKASRIAALEAQNKKLVEALEKACKLEHFKEHTYGGFEFSKCPHHSCVAARALLSEVAQ